jgi:glutaredoxin
MYVLVTRDDCSYCNLAKSLFREKALPFTAYNLSSPSSKWVGHLMLEAGIASVPQVFAPDGSRIGGYTELKQYVDKKRY